MLTYVVDTSVLVKWFNQTDEANIEQALQILEDLRNEKITVIVPNITILELLNVFYKGKGLTYDQAYLALQTFYIMPLQIEEPSPHLLHLTSAIMDQQKLTSYDAFFLALAKEKKCRLISDDAKAHGKIPGDTVILLKDYIPASP